MERTVPGPLRTQGDGMENLFSPERNAYTYESLLKFNKNSFPKENIICITPGPLTRVNHNICNVYKKREPKFVLYEPYKAAVKPIIPHIRKQNALKEKKTKNNLDCNELVSHILLMSNNEFKLQKGIPLTNIKSHNQNKEDTFGTSKSNTEKQGLLSEINYLRGEISTLQSQLAFQAQVNTELKSMLVAAVGEDVETRVNLLTEDKLHLAEALLKSVENLSTHQEQIEWLVGQCEVWRSKFLACSLMVEELANSKLVLSQRVQKLTDTMKSLLNEIHQVRDKQSLTLQNLNKMINGTATVSVSNIIDINEKCYNLSEMLLEKVNGKYKCSENLNNTSLCKTPIEEQAEELLAASPLIKGCDMICKAVVSSANFMPK